MSFLPVHRLPVQSLSQILSNRKLTTPITTGLNALDNALDGGFSRGEIYEISGVGGTGKTSLGIQVCSEVLRQGGSVLWLATLQSVPIPRLLMRKTMTSEQMERLDCIRLTTLASVFLFLQTLVRKVEKYTLIIIDDFADTVNRCIYENEQMISQAGDYNRRKTNMSLEMKKHKSIKDVMKLMSIYVAQSKSTCIFFNSSMTVNVPFVEIRPSPSLTPDANCSSSVDETTRARTPPGKVYQQILKSALGDNPSWACYLRSRITLYKDWITTCISGNDAATFVHLTHNSKQRNKGHIEVISFQMTDDGISEAQDNLMSPGDMTHSFTIDENDFNSSDEDDEQDENSDKKHDILNEVFIEEHLETESGNVLGDHVPMTMNKHPDITTAAIASAWSSQNLGNTESEIPQDLLNCDIETSTQIAEVESPSIGKNMTTIDTQQETGKNVDASSTQKKSNMIETREVGITAHLGVDMMDMDSSLEEIANELEELYPTQPESLSQIHLSQFRTGKKYKVAKTAATYTQALTKHAKRIKNPLQDLYNDVPYSQCTLSQQLTFIPASEPYF